VSDDAILVVLTPVHMYRQYLPVVIFNSYLEFEEPVPLRHYQYKYGY
jgi:hypothetical protein